MPNVRINKGCLVVEKDIDIIYVIRKECILGYHISGNYLRIHTSIRHLTGLDCSCISLDYLKTNQASVKECEKHINILNSILSPEVQSQGDLLAL